MQKLALSALCLGALLTAVPTRAIDLKQSKITQVVNDVQIIPAADQKPKVAAVNDVFSMPDLLRTGSASRAELVASDETVTRVGANTIFSFDPGNRALDLKQGSLLFHAPHGQGGGTIHTGSATASVLGTTLIVTTTTNGGFKVVALEGQVEVKLLNGLRQKLDPGQMTFVLPGANQLAPIVIFRLDELIANSLLVKGFAQTLPSLPLIQNQVDGQLKLIRSGKLADTGLYAGDNATPNQVEVLDINTITHGNQVQAQAPPPVVPPPPPPPPPSDLAAAEDADATINQPSLTDASIPTPPAHVFPNTQFSLANNAFLSGTTFSGFVARNIYVNTPGAAGETIDLRPYAGLTTFDLVAVNDIFIEGPVTFQGVSPAGNLALVAGNQFSLTPGIAIEADAHNFLMESPATMTLNNVGVRNAAGNLTLRSGADVSIQNNSLANAAGNVAVYAVNNISVGGSQLNGDTAVLSSLSGSLELDSAIVDATGHSIFIAPTALNLNNSMINSAFTTLSGTASATISINDTTINGSTEIVISTPNKLEVTGTAAGGSALLSDPSAGTVALSSSFGSVNLSGTSVSAHYLTVNSGDGILLDATGHTITAAGAGATATFAARNLITVNNADLTSYAVVNMAANTIDLVNVAFGAGSAVTLKSLLGLLNVMNSPTAVLPGYVNFYDVTYGGAPAQNSSSIIVTKR